MNQQQRIRALILQEFQAGRTIRQACNNIDRELGADAPSNSTVRKWFKKFETGDTNIRNKNDPKRDEPLPVGKDVYLKANRAILLESEDNRLSEIKTINGRIGYGYRGNAITIADFFHGRFVTVSADNDLPASLSYSKFVVLDDSRILLLEFNIPKRGEQRLVRIRVADIDFNALNFHVAAQTEKRLAPFFPRDLLVDQSNANVFAIFTEAGYILGEIKGDDISIGEHQLDAVAPDICCKRLDGNKLVGLRRSEVTENLQFIRYDLQTKNIQMTEIPSILDNGEPFNIQYLDWVQYTWAGAVLYLCDDSIYRLDTDTRIWSKLNFEVGGHVCMTCAVDDVLTVQTSEYQRGKARAKKFYRFLLRRPDSLINLAWLTVRYHHKFRGSDVFGRLSKRLPYNSYLRCPFPDDA